MITSNIRCYGTFFILNPFIKLKMKKRTKKFHFYELKRELKYI